MLFIKGKNNPVMRHGALHTGSGDGKAYNCCSVTALRAASGRLFITPGQLQRGGTHFENIWNAIPCPQDLL